ncbi:cobalt-precorrin 5A hydrolase [Desulfoscipio sp. XC116]|uniref:cobalt-precorrin 5A hydrolase n=1 Tax=Desulfoscipio sp. XC116 TaxID=3144975 RepID=UPI00325AF20C
MNTVIICLTAHGYKLGQKLKNTMADSNPDSITLYAPNRNFVNPAEAFIFDELAQVVQKVFPRCRQIIFIMALGIAVRVLAKHIRNKTTDPAVVVLDETGQHVISVLSGHLGGANQMARRIAGAIGARPVITTATDVHGLPAMDDLAREYNMAIDPLAGIRRVNSALVNGETVYIYTDNALPIKPVDQIKIYSTRDYPVPDAQASHHVIVTNRCLTEPISNTLFLRPRNLVAGVGCRSGTPSEKILAAIKDALANCRRSLLSLRALSTIEQKAGEAGLRQAAAALKLPLVCFSPEQINKLVLGSNQMLKRSDFVQKIMGVPGVCEPAALLATRKGELISAKQKYQGITVALAEDQYWWSAPDRELPPI